MRVLVVDHNRVERETTQRHLSSGTHDVKLAAEPAAALQMIETQGFDVVIVESAMTGMNGNEVVKRIRATESSGHVYVIVTAAHHAVGDVKSAFAAGADDFIRKPLNRDELLARVDGPARIRRWAARAFVDSVSSDQSGLAKIAAWTSLDGSICTELSEMLGVTLAEAPANAPLDGAGVIASMPLTIPTEMTEVRLAVGVDRPSALTIAEAMFGTSDVTPDMVTDMLREIANVAAGAFKRMAAAEGRLFTTGLPSETTAVSFRSPAPLARRQWIGSVEGTPVQLRFEAELRVREPKRIRASALREGMVVAVDVRGGNGTLLVRAGTRITESHLAGLCNALGHEAAVEVVEAA